jgi:hypothetical protein
MTDDPSNYDVDDMGPAFTRSGHTQVPLLLIGRMDAKIDLLLLQNSQHGERLGALEAWKSKAMGVVIAVSTLAGLASSYLPKIFSMAGKN